MDISAEIAAVQAASQGSELRQPLIDALNKLNNGSLPAVTASDTGKILKVGANGWEVGEKSGYIPAPTATKQITENGTYDVTNYADAVVNVSGSGGGSKNILGGTTDPTSADGVNGDIYIKYTDYDSGSSAPNGYTVLEFIGVDTAGAYIDTGVANTSDSYFEVDCNWTSAPTNNNGIFGAQTSYEYVVNAWQGRAFVAAGVQATISTPLTRHKLKADATAIYIDDVSAGVVPNWNNATGRNYYILANNYSGGVLKSSNARVYSVKIWNGSTLVRSFIPVKRNSDNVLGMYDTVNDVFYINAGTGTFIAGNELSGTPIDEAYLKVNGSWINLEDGEWSDVNTGS